MALKNSKIKGILLMISIGILLLLAVYAAKGMKKENREGKLPFSLVYDQNGISHELKGFCMEETWYFCMPGYMDPKDISMDISSEKELLIGNQVLKKGDSLDGIEVNQEYSVQFCSSNETQKYRVLFMKGSDIPVISLTTASGNMNYIHAERGNAESGYMQVMNANGQTESITKVKSISGRGNTAWDAAKKSYTVKLENAEEILGMGTEKIWVLNANYYDGAYIRNQIGYEMAADGGIRYTPEARFVDLYMNGEYMGLYQIAEKIKTGKNRMNIGSHYLLEIDYRERAAMEDHIMLSNEQPIVIHAPKKDKDVEGVQAFFDEFSKSMEEGNAPLDKIDKNSFAKMFVMEEILQDMDFGYTSHYMYLDLKNGILYDGPVWDMDNTMGRGIRREAEPLFVIGYDLNYNNLSRWYARLYEQPDFYLQVNKEYQENFRPALVHLLEGGIEETAQEIVASVAMDQKLYNAPRSTFMPEASFEENIQYLNDYLQDKLEVLDECFDGSMEKMPKSKDMPKLERQESAFEVDGQPVQEETEQGIINWMMHNRFPVILLVMFASYMILWYRCIKTGK